MTNSRDFDLKDQLEKYLDAQYRYLVGVVKVEDVMALSKEVESEHRNKIFEIYWSPGLYENELRDLASFCIATNRAFNSNMQVIRQATNRLVHSENDKIASMALYHLIEEDLFLLKDKDLDANKQDVMQFKNLLQVFQQKVQNKHFDPVIQNKIIEDLRKTSIGKQFLNYSKMKPVEIFSSQAIAQPSKPKKSIHITKLAFLEMVKARVDDAKYDAMGEGFFGKKVPKNIEKLRAVLAKLPMSETKSGVGINIQKISRDDFTMENETQKMYEKVKSILENIDLKADRHRDLKNLYETLKECLNDVKEEQKDQKTVHNPHDQYL